MGQTVEIAGQMVSIHYCGNTLVSYDPVVYLHSLKGNGSEVWEQCQSLHCPPFTLISIPTPNWNDSLTPWRCEGLFAEDKPFEGNARQHLLQLETIVAQTEKHIGITPQHRCIAGYSLAGLFATWAPFNTTLFDALELGLAVLEGSEVIERGVDGLAGTHAQLLVVGVRPEGGDEDGRKRDDGHDDQAHERDLVPAQALDAVLEERGGRAHLDDVGLFLVGGGNKVVHVDVEAE